MFKLHDIQGIYIYVCERKKVLYNKEKKREG
jgi:hypothetical protein